MTLVIADVPGLIAGAHRGVGLGIDFLRHLERTRALVQLVDATESTAAVEAAISAVDDELTAFSETLGSKPRLLAFNKSDLLTETQRADIRAGHPGAPLIAAAELDGTAELLELAATAVASARAAELEAALASRARRASTGCIATARAARRPPCHARGTCSGSPPTGVERMVAMTDMESEEGVARLQQKLRSAGVDAALAAAGCADGDTVRIGELEFTYADDA